MKNKKHEFHDISIKDMKQYDFDLIKSWAINQFVNTTQSGQVPLIIDSFMSYLTKEGYRIVKKDKNNGHND